MCMCTFTARTWTMYWTWITCMYDVEAWGYVCIVVHAWLSSYVWGSCSVAEVYPILVMRDRETGRKQRQWLTLNDIPCTVRMHGACTCACMSNVHTIVVVLLHVCDVYMYVHCSYLACTCTCLYTRGYSIFTHTCHLLLSCFHSLLLSPTPSHREYPLCYHLW